MTLNPLKWFRKKSYPTAKQDAQAYASGAGKTYTDTYFSYVQSVEALDKVIRIMANVASMAKFEIYKEGSKGELKPYPVKNIDLQYNVNEFDSQAGFLKKLFASLGTQGAAIVIAEQDSKTKFINFYVYNPADFKIEATENSMITEFVYTSKTGSEVIFKPEDVIYITDTIDVTNLLYSLSRLKSLNDILTLQADVMKQQKDFFGSGGKDSVIISPEEAMGETEAKSLRTAFQEFVSSRKTQTLFLNTKVNVDSVSNAQSIGEITKALTVLNNLIIESYGIPKWLMGDYSGYINDKAITMAAKVFFQIQLKPIFREVEHQFTKYFRDTLKLPKAVVKFNFDDVEILEDSLETKIDNAGKLYKLGVISINEAREMVELEPLSIETADLHFLPAYLTSSTPVAIENYDQQIANAQESELPSGSSGGEDNTPKEKPTDNSSDVSVADEEKNQGE